MTRFAISRWRAHHERCVRLTLQWHRSAHGPRASTGDSGSSGSLRVVEALLVLARAQPSRLERLIGVTHEASSMLPAIDIEAEVAPSLTIASLGALLAHATSIRPAQNTDCTLRARRARC